VALIECDFFSESLGLSVSMNVILPQATSGRQIGMEQRGSGDGRHPVLWLLHGLSDDQTIWLRRTSIERYVAPLGLAVVMPRVDRSYYTDMREGLAYWTFVSEELPAIARSFFPLSDRRGDNFVAGLSMGGYGAFKLALRCPARYCFAGSLSGALDVASLFSAKPERDAELRRTFGSADEFRGSDEDLFALTERLTKDNSAELPSLYACCGTADFLVESNRRFRDHCAAVGLPLEYEEDAGRDHEWGYWDLTIQRVLERLPLNARESAAQ